MSTVSNLENWHHTPEEYHSEERGSLEKNEYLAGGIYPMSGASRAHCLIAINLLTELGNRLRGTDFEVFGSDMRLRILNADSSFYYYPDVTVECSGKREDEIDQPKVIFEVLSPSTDRIDRGEKMLNYKSIPSVLAYVLVDQFQPALTIYRRTNTNSWKVKFVGDLAGTLELPEIGCSIPVASIYERVLPAK